MCSPDKKACFVIASLEDQRGLEVSKLTQLVSWETLNGVPHYMASLGGEIPIGATNGQADPCTLEWFLQKMHRNTTRRGTYVAPILEAAGVVDILPRLHGDKQRVRLRKEWLPVRCSKP